MPTLTNDKVAHSWAHQSHSEAKNGNGSFYHDGTTIFSYGSHFPIATHNKTGVILFTSRTYSVTTAKHLSQVSRAIPYDVKVFTVPCLFSPDEPQNIRHYRECIEDSLKSAALARKYGDMHLSRADKLADELSAYIDHFDLDKSMKFDFSSLDMDAIRERAKKARQIEREKEKARQAQILEENRERIERWKNGEPVHIPYSVSKVYLRLRDGLIETSKGANFPAEHSRLLWPVVKSCKSSGKGWAANGHTIKLGYYQVNKIDRKGNLTAGCHYVEFDEMQRIAKQYGIEK